MVHGNWRCVEALLDAGADPYARTVPKRGSFDVLHWWATQCGPVEHLHRWLQRFPDWELERLSQYGHTALFLACTHGPNKMPMVRASR